MTISVAYRVKKYLDVSGVAASLDEASLATHGTSDLAQVEREVVDSNRVD